MLYGSGFFPVQVYDIHVQVLEDEVGDVCHTRTAIRKYQRPRDVKNDPGRVLEKYLQVGILYNAQLRKTQPLETV